jgi:two-component system CheB/CheR fusion protein
MEPIKPSDRLRVLAVDDDADTRETIALLVRLQGHDARTASDGPTALAMAARYRPNVILLDVAMPGMSGWAVARSLRGDPATRNAYIVGITGYARDMDRQRSLEAGCNDHWAKPFEGDQLARLLAAIVSSQSDQEV